MTAWSWLDYAIIVVIALSVITGLFRGFIKEIVALCAWILAIWMAITYSSALDPWLQPYIHDNTARIAVAFVLILLATIIAGGLVNALLSFILHRSGLSGTDRLLGMGFGFVRGIFIVALLMLVVKITGLNYQAYTNQSRLFAKFDPLVDWMYQRMPDFIKRMQSMDHDSSLVDIKPDP